MKKRTTLSLTLFIVILIVALFVAAPFAQGSPATQADATNQQQTVDALVQQRFNETLQAQGPALTQTAAAAGLDATANFQATIDAAFVLALTQTAQAANPQPTAAPTDVPVNNTQPSAGIVIVLRSVGNPGDEVLRNTERVLNRRLQTLGLDGATAARGSRSITITLPLVSDPAGVIESLRQSGRIEFVDFSGLNDQIPDLLGRKVITTAGERWRDQAREEPDRDAILNPSTNEPFETIVTSSDVDRADTRPADDGSYYIRFHFTDDGADAMDDFSKEHIGQPLGVVLDGVVLEIPMITEAFGNDAVRLSGNFTEQDANRLTLFFLNGALPATFNVESIEQTDDSGSVVAQLGTATPTIAATPVVTAVPAAFPTPTFGQIQVAEQVFEHGRMFYVQPTQQIWVMLNDGDSGGTWGVYQDTFEEGDMEVDPSIVAPEGLIQPERGFGKLWRENEEVRSDLGWGITPEFGYVTEYRYYPGGQVSADGQYAPGPGYHVLLSLYHEPFRFNEDDGTWEVAADQTNGQIGND
jgi:hypothetical protein